MESAVMSHSQEVRQAEPADLSQLQLQTQQMVRELLTQVAWLAWTIDSQNNRIQVLERLVGSRNVAREHRRAV